MSEDVFARLLVSEELTRTAMMLALGAYSPEERSRILQQIGVGVSANISGPDPATNERVRIKIGQFMASELQAIKKMCRQGLPGGLD